MELWGEIILNLGQVFRRSCSNSFTIFRSGSHFLSAEQNHSGNIGRRPYEKNHFGNFS